MQNVSSKLRCIGLKSMLFAGASFGFLLIGFLIFRTEYWEEFIKADEWRYYWWSNRLSFNCSYPEEHRGLEGCVERICLQHKKVSVHKDT